MRIFSLFIFFIAITFGLKAQEIDSAKLKEVVIKAYFSEQPLLTLPASVSVLGKADLNNQAPFSLVPAINTVPGVRMEERSPGSYRLSIRGSQLRSPFGIRNVKFYLDDFILTDAGGNTYLNLLDAGSVAGVEILKGPEGSIYGANTGGVVLIKPDDLQRDSSAAAASITAGSFGLIHEKASFQKKTGDFQININQAYQQVRGYRQNSALERKYLHLLPQWQYSSAARLKALMIVSDLQYETPGGLTLEQYQDDPKQARLRAGNFPGAVEQKAAIYNKTLLTGISHEISLSDNLKHVMSFTGSFTNYKNPAINNYEFRDEKSLGLRTYLEFKPDAEKKWKLQAGLEAQQTTLDIQRFDNNSGEKGTMQSSDFLKARQGFGFVHLTASPLKSLVVESALSINAFRYNFESFFPQQKDLSQRKFKNQLMPRFAFSYLLNNSLSLRASVSRGYSPPTLEEVNPSNLGINTVIEAEKGWNHEAGFRLSLFKERVYWDAVCFYYVLKDAIVRGVNQGDQDYYINAGRTRQQGIESEIRAVLVRRAVPSFLNRVQLRNSFTYSYFKFSDYVNKGKDYSDNFLTGVPEDVIVTSLESSFEKGISLFVIHNYSSSLPLDDANTVFAGNYHLLGFKLSGRWGIRNTDLNVFAGMDNLLNEKYSLGNDINASGGRYFNAAATRNFYAGVSLKF